MGFPMFKMLCWVRRCGVIKQLDELNELNKEIDESIERQTKLFYEMIEYANSGKDDVVKIREFDKRVKQESWKIAKIERKLKKFLDK